MKTYNLFAVIFIVLSISCKKESISHQVLLTAQDFPATIGSWWFYKDGSQTDTIKIVDTIIFQNTVVQRWVQINSVNTYNDTMYVMLSDSSIIFCNTIRISSAYLTINFPVKANTAWGPSSQAQSFTAQTQNVTENNITYNDVTYLHQVSPLVYSSSVDESLWIAKDIGIVQHIINDAGLPSHNYQLISYHIN